MATQSRFKKITFREALRAAGDKEAFDSSLFVMNVSPKGNAGRINLTVHATSGQRVAVQIPRVPGPVDLSTQAMKTDILNCPDFRRIIERGFLVLIDTESAEEFYQTPEGAKLHKKLYATVEDDEIQYDAPNLDLEGQSELAPEGVTPFVQNIVHRAAQEGADIDALISELEARIDLLEPAEFDFLCQRASVSEIKEWAATAKEISEA